MGRIFQRCSYKTIPSVRVTSPRISLFPAGGIRRGGVPFFQSFSYFLEREPIGVGVACPIDFVGSFLRGILWGGVSFSTDFVFLQEESSGVG